MTLPHLCSPFGVEEERVAKSASRQVVHLKDVDVLLVDT
jgi:hypothetical protein